MQTKTVELQTLIEYLWSLPVGSFDNDPHAIQNLMTVFGVSEAIAKEAVFFGPDWMEGE